jgi:integrase
MALSLRKRGAVYHARGTVRVGRETIHVREFSTGCRSRADAEAAAGAEERRIREEALEGPAGRAKRLTLSDAFFAYLNRPGGVARLDEAKFEALHEIVGTYRLDQLADVWAEWRRHRPEQAPATLIRYRAMTMPAIRLLCREKGVPASALPSINAPRGERVVILVPKQRARLLASYNPHAACPVLLLAHQGMRTQEVLRLDWRDVDFAAETMSVGVRADAHQTKSRQGRAMPIHPRVLMLLWGMWHAAGKPEAGPVFLSSWGQPYADTIDVGGNPLTSAHETACRAAGVRDFRVHDWRHDWAARCVLRGMDLYSLIRLGGWSSLKMVERYAAVSAEHLKDVARRVA